MRFPRNFGINRFNREMDSEMVVGMRAWLSCSDWSSGFLFGNYFALATNF